MKKNGKVQFLKESKPLPLAIKIFVKWVKKAGLIKKIEPPRRKNVSSRGEIHDLQKIFRDLNTRYFEGAIPDLPLHWFGDKTFQYRCKIVFGSYHSQKKEIKIHRILDQSNVHESTVSFILYHEMLHHVLPPIKKRGKRRSIHHPDFRKREKLFSEYALAQEGIEELLTRMWPSRKKKQSNKKSP